MAVELLYGKGRITVQAPPGCAEFIIRKEPRQPIADPAKAIADVLARPNVKEAIIGLGGVVQSSTPAGLAEYQRAEYAKWGEVVRASGARMN